MTIIALNATSFSGESYSHSLINLETSPINCFPAFPGGNRNRFFLQKVLFKLMIFVLSPDVFHALCWRFIWRYWRFCGELRVFYCFSTLTIRSFLIDKIIDVALDHGLSGSFDHNYNINVTFPSYFRLHLTCLTSSI